MEIDGQDFVHQSLEETRDYLAEDGQDNGCNKAECQQHFQLLSVLQQLVERLHTSNCMLRRINYLQAKGLLDVITQPVTVGSVTIGPDIVDRLNREEAENNQKSRRLWEQLSDGQSKRQLNNWSFDFDSVDRTVEEAIRKTLDQEPGQQGQVRTRSGRVAGAVKLEQLSDGEEDDTAIDGDYFEDVDKDLLESKKTFGMTKSNNKKNQETVKQPKSIKIHYNGSLVYQRVQQTQKTPQKEVQNEKQHQNWLEDGLTSEINEEVNHNQHQIDKIQVETAPQLKPIAPKRKYEFKTRQKSTRKTRKPRIRTKNWSCDWPECGSRFETEKHLEVHRMKHTGELPLKCPNCPRRFRRQRAVDLHMNRVHLNIRPFECQVCGAKFATSTDLASHSYLHGEDKYRFKCEWPGCAEAYMTNYDLKCHQRLHTGDLFRCSWPGCGKEFHNPSEYNGHLSTHTNHGNLQCSAPGCSRMFQRMKEMRQHLAKEHLIKTVACEWPGCDMKFVTSAQLRSHLKLHCGQKHLVCDWPGCQFKTKWQNTFNSHMMAHRGEKPFQCDECGYRTNQSTNLKKHKDGVHRKQMRMKKN